MALFQVNRGDESNLPAKLTDGWAYFCANTGNFYIDCQDENGELQRKQTNAEFAGKLRYLADGEYVELSAQEIADAISNFQNAGGGAVGEQIQSDWTESDETSKAYIKNKPEIPSVEGLASEEYVNEKVDGITFEQVQPDWEQTDSSATDYIRNRPFGLLPDVFEETALTFTKQDDFDYYRATASLEQFELGKQYTVYWDGAVYFCTASEIKASTNTVTGLTAPVLGNHNLFSGIWTVTSATVDNTPFLVMFGLGVFSDDTDATHTLRIVAENNFEKLDAKYLPDGIATEAYVDEKVAGLASETYVQEKISEVSASVQQVQADWAQTDSAQVDYIKNKPALAKVATKGTYESLKDRHFGDLAVVLTETELAFALVEDLPNYVAEAENPGGMLLGETYKVVWDGVEYTCVCTDGTIIEGGWTLTDTLSLGNKALFWNNGQAEDTGEPFYINWSEDRLYLEASDTASTHTVSITPVNAVKKLDIKYLPDNLITLGELNGMASSFATKQYVQEEIAKIEVFGGASGGAVSETDILPERELVLTSDAPEDAGAVFAYTTDEESYALLTKLEVGESYTVVWDGTEYNCVAQGLLDSIPEGITVNLAVVLGNFHFVDESVEDSGEPFAVCVTDYTANSNRVQNGYIVTYPGIAAESVTHTVRIYQTSSGVSWNDIKDKPFGEETVTVFEGVFQDTLVDNDGDGVNDAWSGEAFVEDTSGNTLVGGQTYTITWGGVEYTRTCFDLEEVVVVGNDGFVSGVDDGCPVVIARDATGASFGAKGWVAIFLFPSTDLTISGTYSCKIAGTEVKQIDNKYLSILEGETADHKEVLAEQSIDGFKQETDTYYAVEIESAVVLTPGQQYTVVWDGVEYQSTAFISDGVDLGNLSVVSSGDEDTGEPFFILWGGSCLIIFTSDMTATSHTVRIYQPAYDTVAIKKKYLPAIDDKDLPIMDLNGLEIAPKTEAIFAYQSEEAAQAWVSPYAIPVSQETALAAANAEGQEVLVLLDGVEYETAVNSASIYEDGTVDEIYIGNMGILGGTDTGEHFMVALGRKTVTSADGAESTEYYWTIATTEAAPANADATITHAVQMVLNPSRTIKPEYIPGPPEFDLTAMGLPDIPLDGTSVSAECDTTEMRTAAAKGLVKAIVVASGISVEAMAAMSYVPAADCWSVCSVNILSGTPYVVEINVFSTSIAARAIALATTANSVPTVTAEDDGKFARVVDGEWTAVTISAAEEASF